MSWKTGLIILIAVSVLCVGFYFGSSVFRSLYVDILIHQINRNGSAAAARTLAAMLDSQKVTSEQGEQILTLLCRPKIATRQAYPVGKAPSVSVELPYEVSFKHSRAEVKEYVWVDGESQYGSTLTGLQSFTARPHTLVYHPQPTETGSYNMEIRYTCRLIAEEKPLWYWNPGEGVILPRRRMMDVSKEPAENRQYECSFVVPVETAVVEPNQAEKLRYVSDPKIDKAIHAAFSFAPLSDTDFPYTTPSGPRIAKGGIEINYRNLPVATVFEYVLRPRRGGEIVQQRRFDQPKRLRTGSSGKFLVNPADFLIEMPGEYSGTIVLRPEPDFAYEDPAIQYIWNGTLEFPIGFTVEVDNP